MWGAEAVLDTSDIHAIRHMQLNQLITGCHKIQLSPADVVNGLDLARSVMCWYFVIVS